MNCTCVPGVLLISDLDDDETLDFTLCRVESGTSKDYWGCWDRIVYFALEKDVNFRGQRVVRRGHR